MSINVCAFRHVAWESYGLADYGDFADCVEFINQWGLGDGQLEGQWYYIPEEPLPSGERVIYSGTHGNENAPGASLYTYADIYDMDVPEDAALYAAHVKELTSAEEYDPACPVYCCENCGAEFDEGRDPFGEQGLLCDECKSIVWQVCVSNVGTVHVGTDKAAAHSIFANYVGWSNCAAGRAAGEDVTLWRGDDVVAEHIGRLTAADVE